MQKYSIIKERGDNVEFLKREYSERFYIGIEKQGGIKPNTDPLIGQLWESFMNDDFSLLNKDELEMNFIGLECYPPDFSESHEFDYYALVESKELLKKPGFVSKKLPKGTYVSFKIEYDDIMNQIMKVYDYVKQQQMKVHLGFDYEEYIPTEDYNNPGAILYLSLLLDEN